MTYGISTLDYLVVVMISFTLWLFKSVDKLLVLVIYITVSNVAAIQ
jgi:hypothetical protein